MLKKSAFLLVLLATTALASSVHLFLPATAKSDFLSKDLVDRSNNLHDALVLWQKSFDGKKELDLIYDRLMLKCAGLVNYHLSKAIGFQNAIEKLEMKPLWYLGKFRKELAKRFCDRKYPINPLQLACSYFDGSRKRFAIFPFPGLRFPFAKWAHRIPNLMQFAYDIDSLGSISNYARDPEKLIKEFEKDLVRLNVFRSPEALMRFFVTWDVPDYIRQEICESAFSNSVLIPENRHIYTFALAWMGLTYQKNLHKFKEELPGARAYVVDVAEELLHWQYCVPSELSPQDSQKEAAQITFRAILSYLKENVSSFPEFPEIKERKDALRKQQNLYDSGVVRSKLADFRETFDTRFIMTIYPSDLRAIHSRQNGGKPKKGSTREITSKGRPEDEARQFEAQVAVVQAIAAIVEYERDLDEKSKTCEAEESKTCEEKPQTLAILDTLFDGIKMRDSLGGGARYQKPGHEDGKRSTTHQIPPDSLGGDQNFPGMIQQAFPSVYQFPIMPQVPVQHRVPVVDQVSPAVFSGVHHVSPGMCQPFLVAYQPLPGTNSLLPGTNPTSTLHIPKTLALAQEPGVVHYPYFITPQGATNPSTYIGGSVSQGKSAPNSSSIATVFGIFLLTLLASTFLLLQTVRRVWWTRRTGSERK